MDRFQVKEGVFLVYSSNDFGKEGTDYFTYTGSGGNEVHVSGISSEAGIKPQFIETCHPKHLKRGTKEQEDINSSTSKKSAVINNFSVKNTKSKATEFQHFRKRDVCRNIERQM